MEKYGQIYRNSKKEIIFRKSNLEKNYGFFLQFYIFSKKWENVESISKIMAANGHWIKL